MTPQTASPPDRRQQRPESFVANAALRDVLPKRIAACASRHNFSTAMSRAHPAPVQIARHGFKVPRARSESFPTLPNAGREIEFLMVNAGFRPSQKVVAT